MAEKNGDILIVDDSISVLKSLELYLKHYFKSVKTLSSPNQIPFLLSTENIDIIMLDMNFTAGVNTGNEGIFWLRKILKQDPTVVVIMITAYGDIELAVRAVKEGATDFITKPWDNQKLMATLQTALKLRLSNREIKKLRLKQKQINLIIKRG